MIRHILKDGTILEDITGHLIKREDIPALYSILEKHKQEAGHDKDRPCSKT